MRPAQHARTACGPPVLTPTPKKRSSYQPYRGGRCLVSLPLLDLPKHFLHATQTRQAAPKKPPNQPENRQSQTNHQHTRERRRRKRKKKKTKKKAGAGAKPWGKCGARSAGCRRSPRPARREHKGKPKPQTGFGFPQRLRKRKKERKTSSANKPNRKERERGHKHQSKQGAGLKGHQTKQHLNPEDHETHTRNHTNTQETPNKKNKHQANRVSGELSQQGGGAHGPPCTF